MGQIARLLGQLDYPPVWLLAAIAIARVEGWVFGRLLDEPVLTLAGNVLFWAGLVILGVAALAFVHARSTIVPHRVPARLITTGLYRVSRNPIYLADLMILGGLALSWGSIAGLLLVPVLGQILAARFIMPEEARIRAAFGAQADAYFARTRRWL